MKQINLTLFLCLFLLAVLFVVPAEAKCQNEKDISELADGISLSYDATGFQKVSVNAPEAGYKLIDWVHQVCLSVDSWKSKCKSPNANYFINKMVEICKSYGFNALIYLSPGYYWKEQYSDEYRLLIQQTAKSLFFYVESAYNYKKFITKKSPGCDCDIPFNDLLELKDNMFELKGCCNWELPVLGKISSKFGPRKHPITGNEDFHHGIDIAAPLGTNVYPTKKGKIIFAGTQGGYGKTVIIDHGNGYHSLYAHLSKITVNINDEVKGFIIIGKVGKTGSTTGYHLHFEIHKYDHVKKKYVPQDPQTMLTGDCVKQYFRK